MPETPIEPPPSEVKSEPNLKPGSGEQLTPKQLRRKTYLERGAIVVVALALVALTLVQREVIDLGPSLSDSQGMVALVSINASVILTTFLIFFILRNLYRIFFETQGYGSLQTKLVVAFICLSLLPTLLIFYYSYRQLVRGHDLWFSTQIEEALKDSIDLTQSVLATDILMLTNFGDDIYDDYALLPQNSDVTEVQAFLERSQRRFHLTSVELYGPQGELILRAGSESLPPIYHDWFVDQGSYNQPWTSILETDTGELTRLVWPFLPLNRNDLAVKPTGYLVIGHLTEAHLRSQTEDVRQALRNYSDALRVQRPFRVTQLTALSAMAMLAVLISVWIGSHLASSLTRPVLDLVEGTRKVASGDWDFTLTAPDRAGEFSQLVDSFNLMTHKLKRMYIELDSRRNFLETVLKNVSTGVVVFGTDGHPKHMNQAATSILPGEVPETSLSGLEGLEIGHTATTTPTDFTGPRKLILPPALIAFVQEAITIIQATQFTKATRRGLERHLRFNVGGQIMSLRAGVAPLRNEEGIEIGYLLAFDDLTELEKAQRVAAWREVARRIAHEVKNPLTPIQLSAQRLRRRFSERLASEPDASVFQECTEVIIRQVDQMKNLVDEFSSFARLPEIKPILGDFVACLEESLALFRQAHKQVIFNLEIKDQPPIFAFDPGQMQRVITNILDNAVAAMDQIGEVLIVLEMDELVGLRLTISDSGPGLALEVLDTLFDPHVTTKASGQGLGLAIVRAIISDHGGFIKAKNIPDQGAKFIIELSLRQ